MSVLLQARRLAAGYVSGRRQRRVLEGIEVELRAGELVCLLGPNGCGKSTLLRTLAGTQKPLAGQVEIEGAELGLLSIRQLARRVAILLAEPLALGAMTVAELVALGRYPHTDWSGRFTATDRAAVARAVDQVGIAELATRTLESLSDGERQKSMIARALAQEPKVLLLDEPTAFLDLPGRYEIGGLLRQVASTAEDRAVVLSTHDLDFALGTADRLWLIDKAGHLICGQPAELVQQRALEQAFGVPSLALFTGA